MSPAPRATIQNAKLDRIENDMARLRHNPVDGPMISRFLYDHSNTLIVDSAGKTDLLIQNTVPLASDIARLLQHVSPAMLEELARGYRLARVCGLLDTPPIDDLKPLIDPERAAMVVERVRELNRKPGGIRSLIR